MRWFAFLLLPLLAVRNASVAPTYEVKFLVTVEQTRITAPFPARVSLHLHNGGQEAMWLYRRAANRAGAGQAAGAQSSGALIVPVRPQEGAMLAVRLEPADSKGAAPIAGEVFESVGFPRPKLVRLGPGEDYEEKAVIGLVPAGEASGQQRIAGRYRLSATYAAWYSNAEEVERITGVALWQGEVKSNPVEIELLPPEGTATVAGAVVGAESRPMGNVLVSLSDQEEKLAIQAVTDSEGRFSFTHLPFGLYWVTVRRRNSTEETTLFRHVMLTAAAPAGTLEFALQPPEVHEPKQLLHKPVLLRVTDAAGRPMGKVNLEITWSSGTVLDSVKGQTPDDGTLAMELIPGRNFVTLKRKGCGEAEQRLEVAEGAGIDGFKLAYDCARK